MNTDRELIRATESCARHHQQRWDDLNKAIEAFAVRVLGQERYDNSPCQAHPLELIEHEIEVLRNERDRYKAVADDRLSELSSMDTIIESMRSEMEGGW